MIIILTIGTPCRTLWWAGDVNSISISEFDCRLVHSIRYTRISLVDFKITKQLYWPGSHGKTVIGNFTVSSTLNNENKVNRFYDLLYDIQKNSRKDKKTRKFDMKVGILKPPKFS